MATAEELAKKQRDISIAEFFEKNRHLLGFDNPRKALLTTVKEAVDNSLDACEEAGYAPDIDVEIIDMEKDRFRIIIEDNGPGIVKEQIPKIFAKLLYGSKFHKLSQSLTADEPILIQRNGTCELVPIGTFVDQYCKGEEDKDISAQEIKVPCFDTKTWKYSFQTVSHAIKHKRRNEILRISTQYGKEVKVTGAHSLFIFDTNTYKVKEIEARNLRVGELVVVPKKLPEPQRKTEICLLEYMEVEDVRKNWWYLYTDTKTVENIFSYATVIHKKRLHDKSRKYYQFTFSGKQYDIVDDSYKQYCNKGFIPLWLAAACYHNALLTEEMLFTATIRSYKHGEIYSTPAIWPLTSSFMKFLGLFVAEGHTDNRQIGFTLGSHEKELMKIVTDYALEHGVHMTIEEHKKKHSVRIKLFGGLLSTLLRLWCGRGAKNKVVPRFIYHAEKELRQHFIDYLYAGDGHNTKDRNQLMHTTKSKSLANSLAYLWLLQGVSASTSVFLSGGYAPKSKTYVTTVYGTDIEQSHIHSASISSTKRRAYQLYTVIDWFKKLGLGFQEQDVQQYIDLFSTLDPASMHSYEDIGAVMGSEKPGYKLRHLQQAGWIVKHDNLYSFTQAGVQIVQGLRGMQTLAESDLTLLKITEIERIDEGHKWVYDISVPEGENFVGGFGGISCHNSRGQQGIGISASVMYGQLTTGRPAKIISKTAPNKPAHYFELKIDTQKNQADIIEQEEKEWSKERGTRVEIDLEGSYLKGKQSVDEYLKQTAIVNPHLQLVYVNPRGEQFLFPRASKELPVEAKEIKPHPYGIELGRLMKMLQYSKEKTALAFLREEFSRVSNVVANEILEKAKISPKKKPEQIGRQEAEDMMAAIKDTKIMAPPTDCISPIGDTLLLKGLKKEINAEFYTAVSRKPAVYRGNPFVIECAIAYGGALTADGTVDVLRFANKVPLLYQPGACAITKAIGETNWKSYGLEQSGNNLPRGPAVILVHMASVWVPFTSEAKEALAHYEDIIKEVKLAVQEAGRELQKYTHKKQRVRAELKKRGYIEKYIPHLSSAVIEILEGDEADEEKLTASLVRLLEKHRGELEDIEFDPTKNEEYDEEFANIGAAEPEESDE